jgi:toxin ParE1/3/4
MVNRVVWSPTAIEDVETIATYIARDSPSYAAAVVEKILKLTKNPNYLVEGRKISECQDPNIREQFAYSYRLIYRVAEDKITVLTVIHGKRLLDLEM